MRKLIVLVLAVVSFAVILTGTASAQQYPNVANLKPFSAEADFMSLAGYLRYVTHQQTGQWMTLDEAARVVKQQTGQ
jgi:hypothetical protein